MENCVNTTKTLISETVVAEMPNLNISYLLEQDIIQKIISKKYREFNSLFESFMDAKQEAVICLIECSKKYELTHKCNFNTYYTRMLRYHYLNIYNKKKRDEIASKVVKYTDVNFDKIPLTPYTDYSYDFLNSIFYLKADQRELLYKYFYEEKTFKEIGNEVGVSKQRVEQKLKKILGDIRKKSGPDWGFPEKSKSIQTISVELTNKAIPNG